MYADVITRATLCVIAVFAVVRCPSGVCPSVTLVDCIHTAEDVVRLLVRRPGVAIAVVSLTPCADTKFQGEPIQQSYKIHGVGKICDFRLKSSFISETVRDRPMFTMEH